MENQPWSIMAQAEVPAKLNIAKIYIKRLVATHSHWHHTHCTMHAQLPIANVIGGGLLARRGCNQSHTSEKVGAGQLSASMMQKMQQSSASSCTKCVGQMECGGPAVSSAECPAAAASKQRDRNSRTV
uniref:Uncharacterized protein n=1 Tax=Eutreptiella gymnastica TaxID=73025 RepID=A0A7S4GGQ1_9EUGL